MQVINSRRRWAGHVVHIEERRGTYRVLLGKAKRNRLLSSPRYKWEDNINLVFQEVGWGGMD
jgi:hypothetical protein